MVQSNPPNPSAQDSLCEDHTKDQVGIEVEDLNRSMQLPRLFLAKVNYIHAHSIIDLLVRTEFDVSFTHRCFLFNVSRIEDTDSREFKDSKRCAVQLLGGRSVVVETVKAPKRSNMVPVVLYVKGRVPAPDCNITIDDVDYVNVNRYLNWLAVQDQPFNKTLVTAHKRGMSREGPDTPKDGNQENKRGTHSNRHKSGNCGR